MARLPERIVERISLLRKRLETSSKVNINNLLNILQSNFILSDYYINETQILSCKDVILSNIQDIRNQFQIPINGTFGSQFNYFVYLYQGFINQSFLREIDAFNVFVQDELAKYETNSQYSSIQVFWESEEARQREWKYAKSLLTVNGILKSDGTKLGRSDYAHQAHITHSFIIIEGEIFALSPKYQSFSNQGKQGKVKLAENENRDIFVIKRTTLVDQNRSRLDLIKEGQITKATYQNVKIGERTNTKMEEKHYIKMPYLGLTLRKYMLKHKETMELAKRFDLAIALLEALQSFHYSPDSSTYRLHGDIHMDNSSIDEVGNAYIIDMGKAEEHSELTMDLKMSQNAEAGCLKRDIIAACFSNSAIVEPSIKKEMCKIKNRYEFGRSKPIQSLIDDIKQLRESLEDIALRPRLSNP